MLLRGARRAAAGTRSTAARACGRSRVYDEARRHAGAVRATASARSRCTSTATASGLYFGSELEVHRRAARPHAARSNQRHLQRYLVNGYKALYKTRRDVLRGARGAAAPARWLERRRRRRASAAARYWRRRPRRSDGMSYEEAVAGTRERLIRSVELRLRADVPLAFCMSGGVDSHVADLDRQARLRLRRPRLHDRQLATSATRSRTWSSTRSRELGVRHTRDPARHARTSCRSCASSSATTTRRVYTITYFVHWLLMEAIHEHGYRDLGQRHRRRRAVLAATTTTTSPTCTRCATSRRSHAALAGATGSEHVAPIVRNPFLQDPDSSSTTRRCRDHIYLDADEFARLPARRRSTSRSPRSDLADDAAAQPHAQRALPRVGAGDPARGRPQRHVLLDREPLAVPRPRAVRVLARSRPRHLVRDGMAKAVLRDSMRGIVPDADPRQPPQGRLQRADPRPARHATTPRCAT